MINTDFEKIGISAQEYQVYKALLENPSGTITSLAKKVGITRVTLYKVLSDLEQKCVITKVSNKRTKSQYVAKSPDVLEDFIKNYNEESKRQLELLKKEIPILKALAGDSKTLDESKMLVLRGAKVNEEIDRIILDTGEHLCGFTYEYHVDACFDFDKNYRLRQNSYLEVVMKLGDKFVFPGNKSSIASVKKLYTKNPFLRGKWEPRWIDPKKLNPKINVYCFGDYSAFSLGSYKQKDFLAYVIKDKDIADSMRQLSLFLWENANSI